MKPPTHLEILSLCDRSTNTKVISTEANQYLLDILEMATRGRDIDTGLADRHAKLQIQMVAMALNQAGFDALEILQKTKA